MDVRDVVSAPEVGADDIMQTDNCQGDLVHSFSSWTTDGGADSKRLWRKLAGKGFKGELPPDEYCTIQHFKMIQVELSFPK